MPKMRQEIIAYKKVGICLFEVLHFCIQRSHIDANLQIVLAKDFHGLKVSPFLKDKDGK